MQQYREPIVIEILNLFLWWKLYAVDVAFGPLRIDGLTPVCGSTVRIRLNIFLPSM